MKTVTGCSTPITLILTIVAILAYVGLTYQSPLNEDSEVETEIEVDQPTDDANVAPTFTPSDGSPAPDTHTPTVTPTREGTLIPTSGRTVTAEPPTRTPTFTREAPTSTRTPTHTPPIPTSTPSPQPPTSTPTNTALPVPTSTPTMNIIPTTICFDCG